MLDIEGLEGGEQPATKEEKGRTDRRDANDNTVNEAFGKKPRRCRHRNRRADEES